MKRFFISLGYAWLFTCRWFTWLPMGLVRIWTKAGREQMEQRKLGDVYCPIGTNVADTNVNVSVIFIYWTTCLIMFAKDMCEPPVCMTSWIVMPITLAMFAAMLTTAALDTLFNENVPDIEGRVYRERGSLMIALGTLGCIVALPVIFVAICSFMLVNSISDKENYLVAYGKITMSLLSATGVALMSYGFYDGSTVVVIAGAYILWSTIFSAFSLSMVASSVVKNWLDDPIL